MHTMEEVYEVEVSIPVRITNVPANVVITTGIADSIKVTIKDKGFNLLSYIGDDDVQAPVDIDFKHYASEDFHSIVPVNSLSRQVFSRFKKTNVLSVKPERFEFYYNYGRNKKVPVMLAGKVSPSEMYFLSKVHFSPDSVLVYAAKDVLDKVESVSIKPVTIDNFKDTVTLTTELVQRPGMKTVPDKVRLTLYPDIYSEATVDVPITCNNIPSGKILRTFPSKAKVTFVVGMRQYKEMTVHDFTVTADYNDIVSNPDKQTCHLTLRTTPDNVYRARIVDDEVNFLIEE